MNSPNWFIDLRAQSQGGPVGALKLTDGAGNFRSLPDLRDGIRGVDVLLMTHGFENDRQQGTDSLNEWKSHLNIQPEPFYIGVLWPGDGFLHLFVDYIWEGSEAQQSGTMLGQFVDQNFGAAASVSFGSHSLGVRVMLQAIRQLSQGHTARRLITLAAAIEDDTLINEFKDAAAKVEHITVVYSMQDHVLALAYPAGNLIGGILERGDANVKSALGRSGAVDPVPANLIGNPRLPDAWSYGHTDYLTGNQVNGDFALPVSIPGPGTAAALSPYPAATPNPASLTSGQWKPCWSADFVSSRWIVS
jgi:hypothetical protein